MQCSTRDTIFNNHMLKCEDLKRIAVFSALYWYRCLWNRSWDYFGQGSIYRSTERHKKSGKLHKIVVVSENNWKIISYKDEVSLAVGFHPLKYSGTALNLKRQGRFC